MNKLTSTLIIAVALFLAACSGSSNKETAENEATTSSETRVVHVYGLDKMKYAVKEQAEGLQTGESIEVNGGTYYLLEGITAEAGEELTIELTTISQLPAAAMSHNWVLLAQDADPQAFSNASTQAKENDYIASDMEDQVLHHTNLVSGGNTTDITFNVPDQAGEYDYLCSFPAHFSAGMKGVLTVE